MPPPDDSQIPELPVPHEPSGWEHFELWTGVRRALYAVPAHFRAEIHIEGMLATDIFTLSSPLGATIEEAAVNSLNGLRHVWDPDSRYQQYSFFRQPQTFPDVTLRCMDGETLPLMGIELKGWYLLSREGAPAYRFKATRCACNPWDLLAVVPWVLSNVLAGTPVLMQPFVQSARYCAEKRNYYWQFERETLESREIAIPDNVAPYPDRRLRISDEPLKDSGGNFGRLARYGVMTDYIDRMLNERIRGIPASSWVEFFKYQGSQGADG